MQLRVLRTKCHTTTKRLIDKLDVHAHAHATHQAVAGDKQMRSVMGVGLQRIGDTGDDRLPRPQEAFVHTRVRGWGGEKDSGVGHIIRPN